MYFCVLSFVRSFSLFPLKLPSFFFFPSEVVHVRPRDKLLPSLSINVSDIPILSVSKARDLQGLE